MLSVTFAAVLATALLLSFASTRPLGAVGVFAGVCIKPQLGLLVLAAALCYAYWSRKPAGKQLPLSSGTNRNKGGALVSLLLLVLVGSALYVLLAEPPREELYERLPTLIRSAPSEEVIVLQTPGLLQVSQIRATEVVDTKFTHLMLGVPIGETAPRIRVPAIYNYSVQLSDEIRVVRQDGVFTVVAPSVKPNLPVAIDTAGLEKQVAGTWALLPVVGERDIDDLELKVSEKLASKASSREYIERQREQARQSVTEFVRTWIVSQTKFSAAKFGDVRVYFEDERASAIRAL